VQSGLRRSANQVRNLLTSISEISLSVPTALPWQPLRFWWYQQWAQPDGTVVCFSIELLAFFPSAVYFLLQGLYCCSVSTSFSAFLKPESEGLSLVSAARRIKLLWQSENSKRNRPDSSEEKMKHKCPDLTSFSLKNPGFRKLN